MDGSGHVQRDIIRQTGDIKKDREQILAYMKTRRDDVPGYIRLLKHAYQLYRRKAATRLGEIGDKRAVIPLIKAIEDEALEVQYVSVKSLGMLRDRRAVEPLIRCLTSEEKWIRRGAAHSLGQIGDLRAVDPLIPLLKDSYHDVCAHTAWALGELGDPKAIEPLTPFLEDEREDVKKAAEEAILREI